MEALHTSEQVHSPQLNIGDIQSLIAEETLEARRRHVPRSRFRKRIFEIQPQPQPKDQDKEKSPKDNKPKANEH